jgi:hypothetical protein
MKRTAPGYAGAYAVRWKRRLSRPALMMWALEVARRMRRRGHSVSVHCLRGSHS